MRPPGSGPLLTVALAAVWMCCSLVAETKPEPKRSPSSDWLVSRRGLVWGYALGVTSANQQRVIAFDAQGSQAEAGKDASFAASRGGGVLPRGVARYDHHFAMLTDGGAFVATSGTNHLLNACKRSGAFTVLALLTATEAKPERRETILWLGPTSGSPNLELSQERDQVSLRLRTAVGGRAAESITDLCKWPDEKTHFQAVTYAEGVLTAWLDGEQTRRTERVKGDLSRWRATELVFGDNFQATADWSGKHEGVAIYNRALSGAEIEQQAGAFARLLAARKEPPRLRIIGKLKARSETPKPQRIQPYYQALGVYEYAVEEVKEGEYDGSVILVAHWVIMQRKKLPVSARPIGARVELLLVPYDANPQLENEFWLFDDAEKAELPLMYDLSRPRF